MTLTDALKTELRKRGEPLIAIERATGVSRDSISRFLRGKTLHLDIADRLATYLGIDVSVRTSESTVKGSNMHKSLLVMFNDALRTTYPRLARVDDPKGHHFTIGGKIESGVYVEVLDLRNPDRLEVGLSFNSDSRSVNERNAARFKDFLSHQHLPFEVESRSTSKNRYLTAAFPVPKNQAELPRMISFAVEAAAWFEDLAYAEVPEAVSTS